MTQEDSKKRSELYEAETRDCDTLKIASRISTGNDAVNYTAFLHTTETWWPWFLRCDKL